MRNCIISLMVSVSFLIPVSVHTKTIWKDINIYASGAGLNVGDILVVNIQDISKLKFFKAQNSSLD